MIKGIRFIELLLYRLNLIRDLFIMELEKGHDVTIPK
jgi:hypothetical protein